jgi:hypothetical protein
MKKHKKIQLLAVVLILILSTTYVVLITRNTKTKDQTTNQDTKQNAETKKVKSFDDVVNYQSPEGWQVKALTDLPEGIDSNLYKYFASVEKIGETVDKNQDPPATIPIELGFQLQLRTKAETKQDPQGDGLFLAPVRVIQKGEALFYQSQTLSGGFKEPVSNFEVLHTVKKSTGEVNGILLKGSVLDGDTDYLYLIFNLEGEEFVAINGQTTFSEQAAKAMIELLGSLSQKN